MKKKVFMITYLTKKKTKTLNFKGNFLNKFIAEYLYFNI